MPGGGDCTKRGSVETPTGPESSDGATEGFAATKRFGSHIICLGKEREKEAKPQRGCQAVKTSRAAEDANGEEEENAWRGSLCEFRSR